MLERTDNKSSLLNICMLSPKRVLELSSGEVKTSETYNYRNHRPVQGGLFSEDIFGIIDNLDYQSKECSIDAVLGKRERFGHIELGCNIILPQYLYGEPSILATILDISQSFLEKIVFQNLYIDIEEYWNYDNKLKAISDSEICEISKYGTDAVLEVIKRINIKEELIKLERKISENHGYLALGFMHRKEVLELFDKRKYRLEWMFSERILVLPAGLRPIINYEGKIYSSDINVKYRLILNRVLLLKKMNNNVCPDTMINTQKRLIQRAVDYLFDSNLSKEEHDKFVSDSILERLHKKINRFSDYSARGLVIPDSTIDFERIGIPVDVALSLFKPFVVNALLKKRDFNAASAAKMIDNASDIAKEVLRKKEDSYVVVVSSYPDRLTAFKVSIINDNCFKINPAVYEMLNLSISHETDNIKVFTQLGSLSAKEAIEKMGVKSQIVSIYSEKMQLLPNHYARKWLSEMSKATVDNGRHFIGIGEVFCAYGNGSIELNELVDIRCQTNNGFAYREKTTIGRLIINEFLPQNMGIINRSGLKNKYLLEHNYEIDEKSVEKICEKIYLLFGAEKYLDFLRLYYKSLQNNTLDEYEVDIPNESSYRRKNIQCYLNQISYIKRNIWNLRLGSGQGEKTVINIDYEENGLQEFIFAFLKNRRVAGDIYYQADKIASDGEIITGELIQKFKDYNFTNVYIYTDTINEAGEYSEYAFGKIIKFNPYRLAFITIKNSLFFLDNRKAESLLNILLNNESIVCNESIENIILKREGIIGSLIDRAYEIQSKEVQFYRLKKDEILFLKSYLIYMILRENNIFISIRQLLLLIEALTMNKIESDDKIDLMDFDNFIEIETIGEIALKMPQIEYEIKDTTVDSENINGEFIGEKGFTYADDSADMEGEDY